MPCFWPLLVSKPGPVAAWLDQTKRNEVSHREGLWTGRDLLIVSSILDATYIRAIKGIKLYVAGFVSYQWLSMILALYGHIRHAIPYLENTITLLLILTYCSPSSYVSLMVIVSVFPIYWWLQYATAYAVNIVSILHHTSLVDPRKLLQPDRQWPLIHNLQMK